MARTDPQMNLRVPVLLKERIEKAAFDNNRTITAEAVARLEQSFSDQGMDKHMMQRYLDISDILLSIVNANREKIEIDAETLEKLNDYKR